MSPLYARYLCSRTHSAALAKRARNDRVSCIQPKHKTLMIIPRVQGILKVVCLQLTKL